MDRYLGRYSIEVSTAKSVDVPYKTEDPTIVNLRDFRRGFNFPAIFHITNGMPPQTAVQFQSGLFGGFGDPFEVTLRWFLTTVSHFTLL